MSLSRGACAALGWSYAMCDKYNAVIARGGTQEAATRAALSTDFYSEIVAAMPWSANYWNPGLEDKAIGRDQAGHYYTISQWFLGKNIPADQVVGNYVLEIGTKKDLTYSEYVKLAQEKGQWYIGKMLNGPNDICGYRASGPESWKAWTFAEWINPLIGGAGTLSILPLQQWAGAPAFPVPPLVSPAYRECTPEGATEILEMCPDGSTWKRRRQCYLAKWVEQSQACPGQAQIGVTLDRDKTIKLMYSITPSAAGFPEESIQELAREEAAKKAKRYYEQTVRFLELPPGPEPIAPALAVRRDLGAFTINEFAQGPGRFVEEIFPVARAELKYRPTKAPVGVLWIPPEWMRMGRVRPTIERRRAPEVVPTVAPPPTEAAVMPPSVVTPLVVTPLVPEAPTIALPPPVRERPETQWVPPPIEKISMPPTPPTGKQY